MGLVFVRVLVKRSCLELCSLTGALQGHPNLVKAGLVNHFHPTFVRVLSTTTTLSIWELNRPKIMPVITSPNQASIRETESLDPAGGLWDSVITGDYTGIMEKKMETTIWYRDYSEVI